MTASRTGSASRALDLIESHIGQLVAARSRLFSGTYPSILNPRLGSVYKPTPGGELVRTAGGWVTRC
jgi:hypothetical protein